MVNLQIRQRHVLMACTRVCHNSHCSLKFIHKYNIEDSMRVKAPEGLGAVGVPDLFDYH